VDDFIALAVNSLKSKSFRLSSSLFILLTASDLKALMSFWKTAAGLFTTVILTLLDLIYEDGCSLIVVLLS